MDWKVTEYIYKEWKKEKQRKEKVIGYKKDLFELINKRKYMDWVTRE